MNPKATIEKNQPVADGFKMTDHCDRIDDLVAALTGRRACARPCSPNQGCSFTRHQVDAFVVSLEGHNNVTYCLWDHVYAVSVQKCWEVSDGPQAQGGGYLLEGGSREEPEQGCVVDVGIWRELFLSPSFVRASFLSLLVITEPNWG
jgi:hypothetical protein